MGNELRDTAGIHLNDIIGHDPHPLFTRLSCFRRRLRSGSQLFPGYCIGLLKGFRKLLAFGDVAQRLAQGNQLIVPEEMLEFFMSAGPIAPSADHFIFAGLCQGDGPTAPVPLISAQVDETVACKRSERLTERGPLHGQDLSQLTNGWWNS